MENQAFTRFFGCLDKPGIDGISKDGMYLPIDPKNHSAGFVNISCGTAEYVCAKGPQYKFMDAFFEEGADASSYPYPPQAVANAPLHGAQGGSVQMFAPEQVPPPPPPPHPYTHTPWPPLATTLATTLAKHATDRGVFVVRRCRSRRR